ncbi:MAG: ATP-binding protein [Anaerolineae bacterium]
MHWHLRDQHYLFVIGPSGSGKSSLIRAGLFPRLRDSAPNFWLIREMRPGNQPWSTLAQAIAGDPAHPNQAISDLLASCPPAQRLLLVIDQFEELFAQADRSDQSRFMATLQTLRQVENLALLLAMRADFYPDLMNSDLWPVDPDQRVEIAPLRGEALRQAIRQPAQDVGVFLEADLIERLLADAAEEPGALPMVQETMALLWEEMRDRRLTLDAYKRLGGEGRSGLAVAMATKANAVLTKLSSTQESIARRIFVRLIQFGEGRADTRRQLPVTALRATGDNPNLFEQTLHHLTNNRLLTMSGEEGGSDRRADIAHEALINGWPKLQKWLSERREAEQTRRRLEDKAAEWVRRDRKRGGLLDQIELSEAERWLASPDATDLGYSENLTSLVQSSRAAIEQAEQEKEAARQGLVAINQLAVLRIAMRAIQSRIDDTLNIVRPNITRLRKHVDPSSEAIKDILDIMERNTKNTAEYINRIQEPLKAAETQLVDINASLHEAQDKVWKQYQGRSEFGEVVISYRTDESLPPFKASLIQITEMFRNLIENGYKAMGAQGGVLTIISRRADGWIEVEIQDSGPGIPVEIRDKIFIDPVPSKQPGQSGQRSGLGLWLSVLLLQTHSGEIRIAKTGPQGTTVLVRLPISKR